MESLLFSFHMMHKSQFRKIDPYDWFCDPGSPNVMKTQQLLNGNEKSWPSFLSLLAVPAPSGLSFGESDRRHYAGDLESPSGAQILWYRALHHPLSSSRRRWWHHWAHCRWKHKLRRSSPYVTYERIDPCCLHSSVFSVCSEYSLVKRLPVWF